MGNQRFLNYVGLKFMAINSPVHEFLYLQIRSKVEFGGFFKKQFEIFRSIRISL
jgi:hypothetical protein